MNKSQMQLGSVHSCCYFILIFRSVRYIFAMFRSEESVVRTVRSGKRSTAPLGPVNTIISGSYRAGRNPDGFDERNLTHSIRQHLVEPPSKLRPSS